MSFPQKSIKHYLELLVLILAGEAIFFLPFVLPRIYRPTLLKAFDITNLELGSYFSLYGVMAMVSYFFGGWLADKYSARKLLSSALLLTGFGGMYLAITFDRNALLWVYGYWGITTIFLFWAALIKATRQWGGYNFQGRAFGWLEAGRGGMAALIGVISLFFFNEVDVELETNRSRGEVMQQLLWFASGITLFSATLIWWLIPQEKEQESAVGFKFSDLIQVFKLKEVWINGIVIVCAYVGYKTTDDLSLYAHEVLSFSEFDAAKVGTFALWGRPIFAGIAGMLADRFNGVRIITIAFAVLVLGSMGIALNLSSNGMLWVILSMASILCGVYGIRGIYFALMNEMKVPMQYTGTAVGLISVIGFTPDVFMSPLMGYLLDAYPGEMGHRYLFAVLAGFGCIGLLSSRFLTRK